MRERGWGAGQRNALTEVRGSEGVLDGQVDRLVETGQEISDADKSGTAGASAGDLLPGILRYAGQGHIGGLSSLFPVE